MRIGANKRAWAWSGWRCVRMWVTPVVQAIAQSQATNNANRGVSSFARGRTAASVAPSGKI